MVTLRLLPLFLRRYPMLLSSSLPVSSLKLACFPVVSLLLTFGGLPPLPPSIWVVNITTYVTTTLASVDDYLSWRTQFTLFVILHGLEGMLDGALPQT